MIKIIILLSALIFAGLCRAAEVIEPAWSQKVDGVFVKGEYIDLNTNQTERLYIRYSPLTDNGVELEKVTNAVVVWRAHVEPIIPYDHQVHSKYTHEVNVRIDVGKIFVISAAGFDIGREGGIIYTNGKDAKEVFEECSLKNGERISRRVSDMVPRP